MTPNIFTHKRNDNDKEGDQALVEFALSLPILMLFIMGMIDFSIVLFSYSQAQSSLRSALRYAQLIGHGLDERPYLDCPAMEDIAESSFFVTNHKVTFNYEKADGSNSYDCNTVSNELLDNGDMLQMRLEAEINPFFLPYDKLTLDFQGQRSIVKLIPVEYDPSIDPPDPPAKPTNFTAVTDGDISGGDCVTGNVSFDWDDLNPRPTKVQVHDPNNSDALAFTVDPAMNSYCTDCDAINPDLGYRCYYAVSYANSVPGPASDPVCVYCIAEPSPPTNFAVTEDCISGDVSFTWNWLDGDPPTRAEIRDALDDSVVATLTDDMFLTECTDCDTLTLPGSRSYYMVSINAIGGEQKVSTASSTQAASCTLQDMTSISGYILEDNGTTGDCQDYGAPLTNKTVSLTGPVSGTYKTGDDGFFYFIGLPAGTYALDLPNGSVYTDYIPTGGGACGSPLLPMNITLAEGDVVQYNFGYQ